MWCKQCGQDVPGISSSASGGLCCARCGTVHPSETRSGPEPAGCGPAGTYLGIATEGGTLCSLEDWGLDQSVRHLQARVGLPSSTLRRPVKPKRRRDAAHVQRRSGPHFRDAARSKAAVGRPDEGWSLVVWSLILLGLMLFVCGGMLVGWSMAESRPELWNVGVPVAATGQVGMLLGIVAQLQRVWRNSRHAVHQLDRVDSQLAYLERATTMLGATHGSAAQAFYAHMADQANPQLLLADLKGQLDLLSMSMVRRNDAA